MDDIESLMNNIHPSVATMVRQSLLSTFVGMIAIHAKDAQEFHEITEIANEDFGTW